MLEPVAVGEGFTVDDLRAAMYEVAPYTQLPPDADLDGSVLPVGRMPEVSGESQRERSGVVSHNG